MGLGQRKRPAVRLALGGQVRSRDGMRGGFSAFCAQYRSSRLAELLILPIMFVTAATFFLWSALGVPVVISSMSPDRISLISFAVFSFAIFSLLQKPFDLSNLQTLLKEFLWDIRQVKSLVFEKLFNSYYRTIDLASSKDFIPIGVIVASPFFPSMINIPIPSSLSIGSSLVWVSKEIRFLSSSDGLRIFGMIFLVLSPHFFSMGILIFLCCRPYLFPIGFSIGLISIQFLIMIFIVSGLGFGSNLIAIPFSVQLSPSSIFFVFFRSHISNTLIAHALPPNNDTLATVDHDDGLTVLEHDFRFETVARPFGDLRNKNGLHEILHAPNYNPTMTNCQGLSA